LYDSRTIRKDHPDWFQRAFNIPREEGYVDCDGVQIHYFRWGDASLPGVVLTHGFMAHARCWAFIAPFLAQRFCLVAYDMSGMGDSGWRESYSVEQRASEARAVATALGMDAHDTAPALVCHSYGGSVGLAAVQMDEGFWSALIICDMKLLAPSEDSDFEDLMNQRMKRGLRPHRIYPDYEQAAARFRLAPDQPCENDFLMEYMAYHSLKQVDEGWVWKFDPAILSPDNDRNSEWWQAIGPLLIKLNLPRAIIYGEHSAMMSAQALQYLTDESGGDIPIIQLRDAHHHLMLDQPLAFIASIDALLQSIEH